MNPCPMCGGGLFWRKTAGNEILCATCHPPPAPDCVAESIEAPPAPAAPSPDTCPSIEVGIGGATPEEVDRRGKWISWEEWKKQRRRLAADAR